MLRVNLEVLELQVLLDYLDQLAVKVSVVRSDNLVRLDYLVLQEVQVDLVQSDL